MTNLDTKLEGTKNAVVGTLNQAKGMAREKIGQVTHNPQMQLSGKKDRVFGAWQRNVGSTFKKKNLLLTFTALATLAAAVYYFFIRTSDMTETTNQYSPYQAG